MSSSSSPPTALILASGSPRRRELLASAGLSLTVCSAPCDEAWRDDPDVLQYAARVARQKGQAAYEKYHKDWPAAVTVLSADTIVWTHRNRPPYGKPRDREEAQTTLRALMTAEQHLVSTAFCLTRFAEASAPKLLERQVTTRVWMRQASPAEVQRYLDTGEWSDKAGAYGIQGAAAALVKRLEGSYTNVVGLPLAEVLEELEALASS